jgi:hypothetical protein
MFTVNIHMVDQNILFDECELSNIKSNNVIVNIFIY